MAEGLTAKFVDFGFQSRWLTYYAPVGLERVAAALAAKQISSGQNYISSWSAYVGAHIEIPHRTERFRTSVYRALSKVGGDEQQAPEIPLEVLLQFRNLNTVSPFIPASACLPLLMVLICSLMMIRGIQCRSMRTSHVTASATTVMVATGTRKT